MSFNIVIPCRLKSSRLPEKPLKLINGMPLVFWTWKNCNKVVENNKIFIATDSNKIINVCKKFNINYILTSQKNLTGSDRVAEASNKLKSNTIINLQGDEPLINPNDIKKFINFALKNKNFVTNAYTKIKTKHEFFSSKVIKIIMNKEKNLLYMSRAGIPLNKRREYTFGFKQVCIYGFPKKILCTYFGKNKKKSFFENIEDIEILRFLENNYSIKMLKVNDNILSIDTKKDLINANSKYKNLFKL